jgi:hypothetical protein
MIAGEGRVIEREEQGSLESERELRRSAHEGCSELSAWSGTREGSNALVDPVKPGGLPPSWRVLRGELSPGQEVDRPPPRVWAGIEQTLRVEGLIRD